ncbi:MAG: hypothetical protein ACODAE_03700 [Gemmatimonadota bacterium]
MRESHRAGRRASPTLAALAGAAVVGVVGACGSTARVDYDAEPAARGGAGADGVMIAERAGLRITVGPPSPFPYGDARAEDGADGAGVYRLYTRVRVENRGRDTAFVGWRDAALVGPDGAATRLRAWAVTSARDGRGAESAGGDAAPASRSNGVGALPPGGVAVRGLLPVAFDTLPAGRPLVALCDGCTYRLRLSVRIGGTRHVFGFPFRFVAREAGGGPRLLPWDGDG